MADFLDFLNTPKGVGLLSAVASYAANARRGTPVNNIGRGLAGGLLGYNQAIQDAETQKQQEFMNQYRQMQMDEMRQKQADATRSREQMDKFRAGLPGMLPANTPKLSDDQFYQMMPEIEAFGSDALHDAMKFADQPNPMAMQLANAPDSVVNEFMGRYYGNTMDQMFPKPVDPKYETYYDKETGREGKAWVTPTSINPVGGLKAPPAEAQDISQAVREYAKIYNLDLSNPEQARRAYAAVSAQKDNRAPKVQIIDDGGSRQFGAEQDLRKEFTALPETKAFTEVRNAFEQINAALKVPNGANDLAVATKFMKLLDPGSVVRESELAMAMQTSGAWDRFSNYAKQLATGEKLTPTQRADFKNAAAELYAAARRQYNSKAIDYRGQAAKWKLDPDAVAPPPWKTYGYKSKADAIKDAKNAILKNPSARDEVVRRLEDELNISDHGIK